MKRNKIIAGFLSAVLAVSPAFAEDWFDESYDESYDESLDESYEDSEVDVDDFGSDDVTDAMTEAAPVDVKDMARFNPVLNVLNIKKRVPTASITVITPKGVASEAIPHKAYPQGSSFVATEGVTFRVLFAPASYVVVQGPAKFSLDIQENNRKAIIAAEYGDMNIRVSQSVKRDQVTLKTPIGDFESLVGIFNLRVDAAVNGSNMGGEVIFRTATGSARFAGTSYNSGAILDNNAFVSSMTKGSAPRLGEAFDEEVSGRVGVFDFNVPTRAGGEVKSVRLLPSSKLRISREKPAGSQNWVVTVMGLHSDGSIQSYFSYVENREDPLYWIPEQIKSFEEELEDAEENAEEVAEEEAEEEDSFSDEYPEELGDFDDELL